MNVFRIVPLERIEKSGYLIMVFFSQVRLKIQSAMKHQKETISMLEIILHGLFLNWRLSSRLSLSFLTSSVGLYLDFPVVQCWYCGAYSWGRHSAVLMQFGLEPRTASSVSCFQLVPHDSCTSLLCYGPFFIAPGQTFRQPAWSSSIPSRSCWILTTAPFQRVLQPLKNVDFWADRDISTEVPVEGLFTISLATLLQPFHPSGPLTHVCRVIRAVIHPVYYGL